MDANPFAALSDEEDGTFDTLTGGPLLLDYAYWIRSVCMMPALLCLFPHTYLTSM